KILRIPLATLEHEYAGLEGRFRSTSRLIARDNSGEVLVSKSSLERKVASSFTTETCAYSEMVRLGISIDIQDYKDVFKASDSSIFHVIAIESLKREEEVYLKDLCLLMPYKHWILEGKENESMTESLRRPSNH
ncbi:hypothetical protein Golob_022968, partial [Gossypium lobatum]|nr:hypothetical protein [Gossypium lobatum]